MGLWIGGLAAFARSPAERFGRLAAWSAGLLILSGAALALLHFGNPGRGRYHNHEWADKMEALGLMPTDSGEPGGRRVGQCVTHYIMEGGRFTLACQMSLASSYFLARSEGWRRFCCKSASCLSHRF